MLKFRCRACEQKIGVPEEWAGKVVRCPRCHGGVRVPRMIDVPVVTTQPAAKSPVAPSGPVAPKAPLTPMPPPPRPTAVAPSAQPPTTKPAPAAKVPTAVAPAKKETVVRVSEAAPRPPVHRAPAPEAAPETSSADPTIVTQRPAADFSSLFAGSGVQGVGSSDVREGGAGGGALSEMIDVFGGPEDSGTSSDAAVSDIVRGLTPAGREELPAVAVQPAAPPPVRMAVTRGRGGVEGRDWARYLGPLAMGVGAGALALCVVPHLAKFALPAGAAGLLIATAGAVAAAAAGRRGAAEVALAIGGSAVSVIGIVLAVLLASDVVPAAAAGSRAAAFPRKNLPVARAGDVEVRVASVGVVRPVLCDGGGGWKSARSDGSTMLEVSLEIRDVGPSGGVEYRSWGVIRPESEPVILTDNEGNQLKLIDPSPKVPACRPRAFPAPLRARGKGVADVLLFDVPPSTARELDLRLPAGNCQMRGAFELHIPAGMLRR